MNTADALEWLIEHQDDSDEEDLQLPVLDLDTITAGPSTSGNFIWNYISKCIFTNFNISACIYYFYFVPGNNDIQAEPNLVNIVALTLDSYRQYKKLEFKPSPRVMQSLQEMGFDEKKIVEALKVTGNNQANAVSHHSKIFINSVPNF